MRSIASTRGEADASAAYVGEMVADKVASMPYADTAGAAAGSYAGNMVTSTGADAKHAIVAAIGQYAGNMYPLVGGQGSKSE